MNDFSATGWLNMRLSNSPGPLLSPPGLSVVPPSTPRPPHSGTRSSFTYSGWVLLGKPGRDAVTSKRQAALLELEHGRADVQVPATAQVAHAVLRDVGWQVGDVATSSPVEEGEGDGGGRSGRSGEQQSEGRSEDGASTVHGRFPQMCRGREMPQRLRCVPCQHTPIEHVACRTLSNRGSLPGSRHFGRNSARTGQKRVQDDESKSPF